MFCTRSADEDTYRLKCPSSKLLQRVPEFGNSLITGPAARANTNLKMLVQTLQKRIQPLVWEQSIGLPSERQSLVEIQSDTQPGLFHFHRAFFQILLGKISGLETMRGVEIT